MLASGRRRVPSQRVSHAGDDTRLHSSVIDEPGNDLWVKHNVLLAIRDAMVADDHDAATACRAILWHIACSSAAGTATARAQSVFTRRGRPRIGD